MTTAVETVTEMVLFYEDRLAHLRVALENARIAARAERWDEFEEIVNEAFKYDHERGKPA
jgi:hypothetical protein